jgi:hypothetical protein
MVASPLGEELWLGLRPFVFGPCTLWRTWGTRPISDCSDETFESQNVDVCGIPHLAKYELDVGPTRGLVGGIEFGVRGSVGGWTLEFDGWTGVGGSFP